MRTEDWVGLDAPMADSTRPNPGPLCHTTSSLRVDFFIRLAWQRDLKEDDAYRLLPDEDDSFRLAEQFERALERVRAWQLGRSSSKRGAGGGGSAALFNTTTRALLLLWWPTLMAQLGMAALETAARCGRGGTRGAGTEGGRKGGELRWKRNGGSEPLVSETAAR